MKLRDEMARYGRKEREEGIEQGKTETALKMLKDGMAVDLIAKYTMLSVSAIEKMAKENNLI